MSENRPPYRGGSVVGPVLLIGVGVVLLLQQAGYLNWSLWEIAARLWPVLIIAIGVDILIGHRSLLGAVVAVLIVLALLAGGIMLMGVGPAADTGTPIAGEAFSLPLPDSKAADISLSPDAGKLEVRALSATSSDLLQATFREPKSGNVTKDTARIEDSKAWIVIDDRSPSWVVWNFGDNNDVRWSVNLSPSLPLSLHFALGAGEMDADLSGLKVESVDARLGAGKIGLILPATGDFLVDVSLAVGSVDIRVPSGMAVSAHCTTAIGNCALPNGSGFWSQNYTSPDFDTARNKVRLQISLAIGEAKVQTSP
jgi:hypothetical protein